MGLAASNRSAVGSTARVRWTASEPLAVQPAGRRRYDVGGTRGAELL